MDNAAPRGVRDGVGAAGCVKLFEQRADVEFGGVNRYSELPRNALVRCALGHQREYVAFARRKLDVDRLARRQRVSRHDRDRRSFTWACEADTGDTAEQ